MNELSKQLNTLFTVAAFVVAAAVALILIGAVLKSIANEKHRQKKKLHNILIAIGFTLMGSVGLIFTSIVLIQI